MKNFKNDHSKLKKYRLFLTKFFLFLIVDHIRFKFTFLILPKNKKLKSLPYQSLHIRALVYKYFSILVSFKMQFFAIIFAIFMLFFCWPILALHLKRPDL